MQAANTYWSTLSGGGWYGGFEKLLQQEIDGIGGRVAALSPAICPACPSAGEQDDAKTSHNAVNGDPVPVPHFGLAMDAESFRALVARCEERGASFETAPSLRFEGKPGEQVACFLRDPSGNALEFKAMTTPANLFARYDASA